MPSSYPPGFQPLVRDPDRLPFAYPSIPPSSVTLDHFPIPSSALISQAESFLQGELNNKIWNHSIRAYIFGAAVCKIHLQSVVDFDAESFYLACMFHDIGCTEQNVKKSRGTKLSFEYWGGITAREWLLAHSAPPDLADSVAEAIFRHTDFNHGHISLNGQLIQLGTLLDNIDQHGDLLSDRFIREVNERYPRLQWGTCFQEAMEREVEAKPWSHATELRESGDKAWNHILNNRLEELF